VTSLQKRSRSSTTLPSTPIRTSGRQRWRLLQPRMDKMAAQVAVAFTGVLVAVGARVTMTRATTVARRRAAAPEAGRATGATLRNQSRRKIAPVAGPMVERAAARAAAMAVAIAHLWYLTGALTSASPFWCTTLRNYTSMRSNVERGSTPPHILPHSRSPNFVCSNVSEVFVLQC